MRFSPDIKQITGAEPLLLSAQPFLMHASVLAVANLRTAIFDNWITSWQ